MAIMAVACVAWLLYLNWQISRNFEGRRWNVPAHAYAQPLELYSGLAISAQELEAELTKLGYRRMPAANKPGSFRRAPGRIDLMTRRFQFWDTLQEPQQLSVRFDGWRIESVTSHGGEPIAIARLDPLLVGSIFASHGEDRIVVPPEDVPPVLPAALKVVEDRKFEEHFGVDPLAIARALLANLRAGEIRQGGSTLTQQLVKSFFLDNRRTLGRKIQEGIMALMLEARYTKEEILNAYINEVYLGQDGRRAIHGFGLASQFYFSKPLAELDLHEVALLVAVARGPSYYDPRKHPDRARQRRDLVLSLMAEHSIVSEEVRDEASRLDLDISETSSGNASYYPAFMKTVREQLIRDYREEDLTSEGLTIFTTLNQMVQTKAEAILAKGLAGLDRGREQPLEGAVVVTSPQNAEILAVVGGRMPSYDGFNRALDARRPIGSLIKPVVYLAALQSGHYHLASLLEDTEVEIELEDGSVWTPTNYDENPHGVVPLIRALAESMNLATVRLGMNVGVARVAATLEALGQVNAPPYPSLLLGAVDLAPLEVAQIYNTIATEGFYTPLRAVRSVLDASGKALQRYPLRVNQAADPIAVYQLNRALVAVLDQGTGRSSKARLSGLVAAGKTGSSDGLRDSWFAGFTADHLAVVWIGYDDNESTGLTGSTGALGIWANLMQSVSSASYGAVHPESLHEVWIEYTTGLAAAPGCGEVIQVPLPAEASLQAKKGCKWRRRVPRWLQNMLD